MMRSSFFGLNTLLRGLMAQQTALDTVNHNISNANTEGYSRQRVNMAAPRPFTMPSRLMPRLPGQMGTGVEITAIQRMRDRFVDEQLREQSQLETFWKQIASGMQQVESLVAEPSDHGVATLINRFFTAWQEVADNPSSQSARVLLREQAQELAGTLNQTDAKLRELRQDLDMQIALRVPEINDLASRIASLNAEIMQVINVGNTPNDLQDQRDLLLDQLAKLTGVEYREMSDGSVSVFLRGHTLVVRDEADEILVRRVPDTSPATDAAVIQGNTAMAVAQGGPDNISVGGLPVDPRAGSYSFSYTGGQASTTGTMTVTFQPTGGGPEPVGTFQVTAGESRTDMVPGATVQIGTVLNPGVDTANAVGGREGTPLPAAGAITRLQWARPSGVANIEITEGEMGALFNLRDTILPGKMAQFDQVARALVEVVNRYHRTGIGLDGASGRNFFNPDRTTAQTIVLDANIFADHRAIAAGGAAGFGTVTVADPPARTVANVALSGVPDDGRTGRYFFQYARPPVDGTGTPVGQGTLTAFFEPNGGAREKIGETKLTHSTTSDVVVSTLVPGVTITLRPNPEDGSDMVTADAGLVTGVGTLTGPGNNRMALTIANLVQSREVVLGGATFEDFYSGLVAQLGVDVRQAERQAENQGLLTQHLDRRRESISGVSLDEEATRLIQFQRAYQAAARGITVLDQMLETIMSMGIVGR